MALEGAQPEDPTVGLLVLCATPDEPAAAYSLSHDTQLAARLATGRQRRAWTIAGNERAVLASLSCRVPQPPSAAAAPREVVGNALTVGELHALVTIGVGCILTFRMDDLARQLEIAGEDTSAVGMISIVERALKCWGLPCGFVGCMSHSDSQPGRDRIVAILANDAGVPLCGPPDSFKITAVMAVYNEADIICSTIKYLKEQGIDTYVIDNWSTDGTYELVLDMAGDGLVGIERFPLEGPSDVFEYKRILGRQEELSSTLDTDWVYRYDADERRESPWPGVTLRTALYHAQQLGYNAVDHTQLTFHPVDNSFTGSTDVAAGLSFFDFEKAGWAFKHVKAWRKTSQPVDLASCAGHDVQFPGKRVFPYKFLLRHYPVRSQVHGERKVLQERKARFDPKLRAVGWHVHYDHIDAQHCFIASRADLLEFREDDFYSEFLLERLFGIGALRGADKVSHPDHQVGPRAAVIIPTFNRTNTMRVLYELRAQDYPVRIYLVDNSMSQMPLPVPQGLEVVTITPDENLGWLRGTNLGLAHALEDLDNEHFLLLNDDVRLSPGFLEGLAQAADGNPQAALIGPVYDDVWRGQRIEYSGPAIGYRANAVERTAWGVDGTAMYVPRETLESVGLLDDSFFAQTGWGADIDLAIRIAALGKPILVTERAYLNHLGGATARTVVGDSYVTSGLAELERGLVAKYGTKWRELIGSDGETAVRATLNADALPAVIRSRAEVVMTLSTLEDEDAVRENVQYHLSNGVQHVIAVDHGSTDATVEILEGFRSTGQLTLVQPHGQPLASSILLNYLSQYAADELGAKVVFHAQAEEFWLSRNGDLGEELIGQPAHDYLEVRAFNVLLEDRNKAEHYLRDANCLVQRPVGPYGADAQHPNASPLLFASYPRIMLSTQKGALRMNSTLHAVETPATRRSDASDTTIVRFPIRSWRSFVGHVRMAEKANETALLRYRESPRLWTEWAESYRRNKLYSEYRSLLPRPSDFPHLYRARVCTDLEAFIVSFRGAIPPSFPGSNLRRN